MSNTTSTVNLSDFLTTSDAKLVDHAQYSPQPEASTERRTGDVNPATEESARFIAACHRLNSHPDWVAAMGFLRRMPLKKGSETLNRPTDGALVAVRDCFEGIFAVELTGARSEADIVRSLATDAAAFEKQFGFKPTAKQLKQMAAAANAAATAAPVVTSEPTPVASDEEMPF